MVGTPPAFRRRCEMQFIEALGISTRHAPAQVVGDGRAPAVTLVVTLAALAGVDAEAPEAPVDGRVVPDLLERLLAERPGQELLALQERARIQVALGPEAARELGRTAQVEPEALTLLGGEREEAVAGPDACRSPQSQAEKARSWARRRPQVLPVVGATPRRAEPAHAERDVEGARELVQRRDLVRVLRREHRVDAGGDGALAEQREGPRCALVRPGAADRIARLAAGAVQAHLDGDQPGPGEPIPPWRDRAASHWWRCR